MGHTKWECLLQYCRANEPSFSVILYRAQLAPTSISNSKRDPRLPPHQPASTASSMIATSTKLSLVNNEENFSSVAPPAGKLRGAIDILFNFIRNDHSDIDNKQPRWDSFTITEAVNAILDIVTPFLDDPRKEPRILSLNILSLLHAQVPVNSLFSQRQVFHLLSLLPSSLLWGDSTSSIRCAPLLTALASSLYVRHRSTSRSNCLDKSEGVPPPLTHMAYREWDGAVNTLLKSAHHHTETVVKLSRKLSYREKYHSEINRIDAGIENEDECGDDDGEGNNVAKFVNHIYAASTTLSLIPILAQHRLLPHSMDVIIMITTLFPHAASISTPTTSQPLHACANAICDTISMSWCLSYLSLKKLCLSVFTATLSAVMEVNRRTNPGSNQQSAREVCEVAQKVLARLAVIDVVHVRELVELARERARKYQSLSPALDFLDSVHTKIATLPSSSSGDNTVESNDVRFESPLIKRFFCLPT